VRALAPGVALEAGRIDGELPGFLGLSAILSTTDLIAILPRHIGETLARAVGLRVLPYPFEIPGFTVKQYWHARYHHDAACRWLRGVCAELFMKSASSPDNTGANSYLFDSNL
jgi:DNA-binding transcriptional LysR family regulator